MTSVLYAGIDTAKSHLDAATRQRSLGRHPNTAAGWKQLGKRLLQAGVTHAVFESTGGYELQAVDALQSMGLAVCIVKPVSVRRFAEAMDILAKSDRIDARVIAAFAESRQPRERVQPSPQQQEIRALFDRRSQIVEDRVREEGRLETVLDREVAKLIRSNIRRLKKEEERLTKRLATLQAASQALLEQAQRWQEIAGVGLMTALAIQAYLPEIGTLSRQQIGALVGVAPFERSSGTHQGKRSIRGGRAQLRRVLYMSAMTAVRFDAKLKHFYQDLRKRGKQNKVALIASLRKLAVRINAIEKEWLEKQALMAG